MLRLLLIMISSLPNAAMDIIDSVLSHGAAGDGVQDDTAFIQAALDSARDEGGGTVFLPVGTYKITSALKMASRVTLRGAGEQSILDWRGTRLGNGIDF